MSMGRTTMRLGLLVLLLGGCTDLARVKGYEALRTGDYATAKQKFEYCIDRVATDWKSHYFLGIIALDHGKDSAYARRHLELADTIRKAMPPTAVSPAPGSPQTKVPSPTRQQIADALAEAIYRQGWHTQLYNYVREQATEYGQTEDYLRMARYLGQIGDRDRAVTAYIKASMVAPNDDPRPHLELANFYDKINDKPSALVELRKAYYIDSTINGLADNIRAHGIVPGPTIGIAPQREKPKIVKFGADEPKPADYPKKTVESVDK